MNTTLIIILETIAITLIGSLLHFTYGWSKENKIVGIFSAVNESTWEHVKLALSGVFCCMLVDVWFLGSNPNYWLARSFSFVAPVVIIPVLFYGYQVFIHRSVLPLDIACFVIAAFISSWVFVWILGWEPEGMLGQMISMVISFAIIVMYLLLTKFPLHNFLFRDPINHRYGYAGFNKPHKKSARLKSGKRKTL